MFRGAESVPCWIPKEGPLAPPCSGQLSLCVSVTWSCPFSLHLDSSSTQCLIMGVCLYFQQVVAEGSIMVDKLVVDLNISKGDLW